MEPNQTCNTPTPAGAPEPQPPRPGPMHKMKWYYLLIYFLLFYSALTSGIAALGQITGMSYSLQSRGLASNQLVYSVYGPGLKVVDVCYGVALLAFAAFALVLRFRLAGYRKNAPKLVLCYYLVGNVISVLYALATEPFTHMIAQNPSAIWTLVFYIICGGVMALLNYIYFSKRARLFVR